MDEISTEDEADVLGALHGAVEGAFKAMPEWALWLLPIIIPMLFPAVRQGLPTLLRRAFRREMPITRFDHSKTRGDVVGRAAFVAALHEHFAGGEDHAAIHPVVIAGGPGIGKTTVAREYHELHARFYDQTIGLHAESRPNLIAQIVERFGDPSDTEGDPDGRARRALIRAESAAAGRKWLMIYDNVVSEEQVERLLPKSPHIRILITTNDDRWNPVRFELRLLDLLTPEDALELLLLTAERKGDADPEAKLLVEDLGRRPVGLVQAGEYLRFANRETFAEYRERLSGASIDEDAFRGAAFDASALGGVPDYPRSAWAATDLHLAQFEAEQRDHPDDQELADAMALLSVLPWLAPEGMDAALVLDVKDEKIHQDDAADWDPRLRALAADPARLQAAISALARRSLATAAGAGAGRRVALHRITVQVLRARQEGAGQADTSRRAAAALVAASYPGTIRNPANWPTCRRLTPHVAALAGAAAPATAAMDFLLNQAALFLEIQDEIPRALGYAEQALALRRARLGETHEEVGTGLDTLGVMLLAAGKFPEAIARQREAVAIAEAQGEGYAHLGAALSDLAGTLADAALAETDPDAKDTLLAEAERLVRRAWARDRRLLGPRHEDTAIWLNTLSTILAHRAAMAPRRQPRVAARPIPVARLALRRMRQALAAAGAPPGDPRLGAPLNNLGSFLLLARDPAAAAPLLREADAIRAKAHPDNPRHRDRVNTADWLAACLLALPAEGAEAARNRGQAEALCTRHGLSFAKVEAQAKTYRPR